VNTDWSPGVLLAALALLVLPILAMLALHWDSYPDDDRPRRNLSYGLAYMPGIFPPETEADHREMYFSGGVSMCRTKGVERVAEELKRTQTRSMRPRRTRRPATTDTRTRAPDKWSSRGACEVSNSDNLKPSRRA
jgi:hypothetical protein